jgi:hypothetical protein
VRVKSAVETLKRQHGGEMHLVPGTTGRIDKEESRGYLLGAVLGRGLLTREKAAAAGQDARNKLNALERRLATQKETARRAAAAARKAGGDAPQRHAATAATARRAIEREPITLELPDRALPPPPPPPPPRPRKRAREPEVRSEFEPPSRAEALAACNEAGRVCLRAMDAALAASALLEAAMVATEHVLSRETEVRERAEATGLRDMDWLEMSAAEWRRYQELENAVERAIDKSDILERREDAARAAADAARAESDRCRTIYERMTDWLEYPGVITPFPWQDTPYMLPCNRDDLYYYKACPRGFPAGVREWKERYDTHIACQFFGVPPD